MTADGCWSVSLKTLSMTESSVLVVSRPQKAHQSLTTIPAPMTSLPRFTVPAWPARGRGREREKERGEREGEKVKMIH